MWGKALGGGLAMLAAAMSASPVQAGEQVSAPATAQATPAPAKIELAGTWIAKSAAAETYLLLLPDGSYISHARANGREIQQTYGVYHSSQLPDGSTRLDLAMTSWAPHGVCISDSNGANSCAASSPPLAISMALVFTAPDTFQTLGTTFHRDKPYPPGTVLSPGRVTPEARICAVMGGVAYTSPDGVDHCFDSKGE
ncbi:MAG TPA: hypothetical protein VHW02_12385 [Rhizomicrobium sp.]|jgi:hypothetical protein|nr:hypothetical protein [Rhizomicrobium sp.]